MTGRALSAAVRGIAVLAFALASPAALARDPLVGSWAGHWSRGGEDLDLALVIRPGDAADRYRASLTSRGLRLDAVPIASARHDGCCGIQLVLSGDAAATHFRASIHGGELRGTSAADGGARGTFTLQRVSQSGEATR
jgi:hypothetical protein